MSMESKKNTVINALPFLQTCLIDPNLEIRDRKKCKIYLQNTVESCQSRS